MTKLYQLFIIVIFVTFSSCSHTLELFPITNYTNTPEKRLLNLVAQACPRLTNSHGGRGTGILISNDGYIMTDLHVTGIEENLTIDFFKLNRADNNYLERSFTTTGHVIFFSDPKLDFTLIKADSLPKDVVPLVLGSTDALKIDQPVWHFGYNKNYHWSYGHFVVADSEVDKNYVGKKIMINGGPGSSGGPIVNSLGQILGIVQRGYFGETTITVINNKRFPNYNPSVMLFMPIDMIHDLLLQAIQEKTLKIEGF